MSLVERVLEEMTGGLRGWPVGKGALLEYESRYGHDDSEYSPEEYGDYIVTSNEVYSAAALRARLKSGLVMRLYRGRDASKREIEDGPAVNLLRNVNPYWTWPRLARMDELCMCVFGETVWALEPGPDGPKNIWWLKPSRVRPVPHAANYLGGFIYESITGEQIPFEPEEIAWFRYPNPLDEFSALSPLSAARLAADTASAMMKSNRNLFSNGMQLGGFVVPSNDKITFSQKQAEELEQLLSRRFKGVDKAHRWAVLRYEAQLKQAEISPKDAEFVNGLNLTLRQVANAYGIPVPLLNELSASTLANVREYQRQLWEHALVPDSTLHAADIEQQVLVRFRRQGAAATPNHLEFDFSSVPALQESASEAWEREGAQIERGALTINEWRKSKGMPPVAWGDVYWAPVNKGPVDGPDMPVVEQTGPRTVLSGDDDMTMRAWLADWDARYGPIKALNGKGK